MKKVLETVTFCSNAHASPTRIEGEAGLPRPRGPFTTAPALPANFIMRPEELESLRQAVISDEGCQVALTALHGMGGIGKTVLARALCHDERVQQAFPDGVIWVDIGREAGSLDDKIRQIGKALGDVEGVWTEYVRFVPKFLGLNLKIHD